MFKEIAQSVWGKTNEGLNRFMKEYDYDLQGGRVEIDKRKYELVSFHSGRQTFITNCLISGIDVPTTMGFWVIPSTRHLRNIYHCQKHIKKNNTTRLISYLIFRESK